MFYYLFPKFTFIFIIIFRILIFSFIFLFIYYIIYLYQIVKNISVYQFLKL